MSDQIRDIKLASDILHRALSSCGVPLPPTWAYYCVQCHAFHTVLGSFGLDEILSSATDDSALALLHGKIINHKLTFNLN